MFSFIERPVPLWHRVCAASARVGGLGRHATMAPFPVVRRGRRGRSGCLSAATGSGERPLALSDLLPLESPIDDDEAPTATSQAKDAVRLAATRHDARTTDPNLGTPKSAASVSNNSTLVVRPAPASRNRLSATSEVMLPDSLGSIINCQPAAGQGPLAGSGPGAAPPPWDDGRPQPQLQSMQALAAEQQPTLQFADDHALPVQGFLELRSQEEEDLLAAKRATLPPLQSVIELTTAFQPPTQSLASAAPAGAAPATETATATAPVGRQLADGTGVLADGTTWTKTSGEEFGPSGFWKRWTRLEGKTADGQVAWEETWWEASDWVGMKELGATKTGTSVTGAAWKETWTEKAFHDPTTYEMVISRTAHKWARAGGAIADEWEEKWGEQHHALGRVNKYADKWARQGPDVWHERWGEDYDGRGACTKWTDKWAERDLPGGRREQWGDKWTEIFGAGKGEKHGEVWSQSADGGRYNRWWNEEHYGNGWVRKYGNSTTDENWDTTEAMDTYYNPVPHFSFHHAVRHSPGLMKVAERPRRASDGAKLSGPTDGVTVDAAAETDKSSEDDQLLGQGLAMLDAGAVREKQSEALVQGVDVLGGLVRAVGETDGLQQGTQLRRLHDGNQAAPRDAHRTQGSQPESEPAAPVPVPSQPPTDITPVQPGSLDWDSVLRTVEERERERQKRQDVNKPAGAPVQNSREASQMGPTLPRDEAEENGDRKI